ncbi:hypothetical protein AVEN_232922-1 [Araneus ventricosus]|uniref:Uncharacterized protein n=1 Tax=Araneus ventricosus TaxID=182803 RepID=A0A4Y1ZKM4_ARAVE|nr:hypothetical protein AVEN_232922-1 [Araneus ventricosus]
MAVLPPLEKRILQSRESDADAEMSSSSASEEDALEYNMSEDLEDSPAAISPPPPSKPEKANKYKNSHHRLHVPTQNGERSMKAGRKESQNIKKTQ